LFGVPSTTALPPNVHRPTLPVVRESLVTSPLLVLLTERTETAVAGRIEDPDKRRVGAERSRSVSVIPQAFLDLRLDMFGRESVGW